ncbi:heterokaryon incompatibility protein [Apiospora aurea]|uniref:Heterokaryon incompatibility protein n=1 Tax=Apiospora aurea TaxID=335848 RepID=A0ABR1PRI3_9PEZI
MEAGLELLGSICATNDIRTLEGLNYRFPTDQDPTTGKPCTSWRAATAAQRLRSWEMTYEDQDVLYHALFRPAIWDRIWVVQELACAPRVVLVAGRRGRLEWDVVARFLAPLPPSDAFHGYVGSHGSWLQLEVGMLLAKLKRINDQRTLAQRGEREGLLDVLARWSESASTDPRDRIYAVLGLAPQELRFAVDYSRTLPQVHLDAARAIINFSANLDIIAQNPWPHDKKKAKLPANDDDVDQEQQLAQHLPSWVPSFTMSLRTPAAADERHTLFAGPLNCQVPCLIADDENGGDGALRTRGVVLDAVGKIIPEPDRERHYRSDSDETQYVSMRSCVGRNLLDDDEAGPVCYVSGEPAFTAYWRTLATDRSGFPMKRLQQDEIETLDGSLREKMRESMRRHDKRMSESNDAGLTEPTVQRNSGKDAGDDPPQEEEPYLLEDTICDPVWCFTYTHWGFNVTEKGLYTMLLRGRAQQGDVIACLEGAKVPLVLRPKRAVDDGPSTTGEVPPRFEVIGPAYVHGFMDLEAFESVGLRERLQLKTEDIFLV